MPDELRDLEAGERRPLWRLAADLVTAALGLNVWVSLLLVPGLFVGAFPRAPMTTILTGFALVPLAVGIVRRSALQLLLVYPAAILLPMGWDERIVMAPARNPLAFAMVAVGLVAYLLGASVLSSFAEAPQPERLRRMVSAAGPLPVRWRRRFRVYAALAALTGITPLVLLYAAHFSHENTAYLRELYPGRARSMATLLGLGVLALWLGLFQTYFLGPMRLHRSGDRQLLHELVQLKVDARRQGPRPTFYAAVFLALGFMALLVISRYR